MRDSEHISPIQEMFDNIWFLFFLSAVIVLVSYIAWGLIDLINVPVLP